MARAHTENRFLVAPVRLTQGGIGAAVIGMSLEQLGLEADDFSVDRRRTLAAQLDTCVVCPRAASTS